MYLLLDKDTIEMEIVPNILSPSVVSHTLKDAHISIVGLFINADLLHFHLSFLRHSYFGENSLFRAEPLWCRPGTHVGGRQ